MGEPFHDFVLVAAEEFREGGYARWSGPPGPGAVRVADDVLRYMSDTLAWIPTENPAGSGMRTGHGLNFYGPTVLRGEGARVAQRVFAGWAELFASGPAEITLTTSLIYEGNGGPGHWERMTVPRDALVGDLRRLAAWAERAGGGAFVLLHLGI